MNRTLAATLIAVGAGVIVVPPMVAGAAAPSQVCSQDTFSWSGSQLFTMWNQTYATGVVVPPASSGETISVVNATYTTFDQYPDGQVPSRADAAQQHESVSISVGGVQVGGLSADVPDGVPAAPTDWFSGYISGSFGGSGTSIAAGGEITIRHSSLFGFTESPNSVHISQLAVVIERCVEADAPTTTEAPSTTAPATTAAPTTTIGQGGTVPTTTLAGQAGPTPPPTSADSSLPATGAETTVPLVLGLLAAGTGIAMLFVRRRSPRV